MKQLNINSFTQAAFIAENASVMGQVTIGEGASIWYSAVVRGDVEKIKIGAYTNIQDGAIIHGDPHQETILEDYVTVGHRAVIHSAHIKKGCLIGIGAIILNGVTVGEGSIIGAGCVVTKDVPSHSLMVGIPAKKIRDIGEEEAQNLIQHALKYYQLGLYHAGKTSDKGFC
ncbi:gamma carbonic anhydrase family protein [Cyanobacterium aponinum FACHB-4101]|uniref:gamma carbonic anhydrase family protein n=1 Tax=Cyanobacterium aponinum TaxID=379064 RepID=UPI00168103B7|nr:gamma carbonic anhydrase family protein [Cyanobacterium aponinum]MBD2392913.1 gamma carbonic anhydrase family protein [Cyanobacterium aponinum FACHB-4101]